MEFQLQAWTSPAPDVADVWKLNQWMGEWSPLFLCHSVFKENKINSKNKDERPSLSGNFKEY